MAYFLPISLPLKQVLVVQAALPAAMFPIILARHYGGQVGIAVQVVLSTTALSIATIPLIIYIGMKLLAFSFWVSLLEAEETEKEKVSAFLFIH